jgi:1,4-alpha-glucan branching enzyme
MFEWDHNSSLAWHLLENPHHAKIQAFVKDLNRLYRSQPAMHEMDYDWRGFEWVDFRDADSTVVSFLRKAKDPRDAIFFVFNFTPLVRDGYRVGVPSSGVWRELINSDSEVYGGSNVGMGGGVMAEPIKAHGRDHSVSLRLPPLGFIALKSF